MAEHQLCQLASGEFDGSDNPGNGYDRHQGKQNLENLLARACFFYGCLQIGRVVDVRASGIGPAHYNPNPHIYARRYAQGVA